MSNDNLEINKRHNVLLVGQIYLDTILHVAEFPEEDTKVRAIDAQQRTGGNTCNTAEVLTQFHHINVCYMSAVGSRETSNHIVELLRSRNIVQIDNTLLYRENATIPSSTIIHNEKIGSRTIISHTNVQDILCNEFLDIFERINKDNHWWVHFEGRNIDEAIKQIDWLHKKATNEQWRNQLIVSVELEKPEREDIEQMIEKGDVVFFSKIFAQHHGFKDAKSFLQDWSLLKEKLKPRAKAFCTWGSDEAAVLDNLTKEMCTFTPENLIQVIDTVGAGDTFNAGVISSYLQQQSLLEILQFACNLATNKVSQQGFENLV